MKIIFIIIVLSQFLFAEEFVVVYNTVCKEEGDSFELTEGKFPIQFNSNNSGDITLVDVDDKSNNITFHPVATTEVSTNDNGTTFQHNKYISDNGGIIETVVWGNGTILIVDDVKFIYTKCNKNNFSDCIGSHCVNTK